MKNEDFKVGMRFQTNYGSDLVKDTILKIQSINKPHCQLSDTQTAAIKNMTLGQVQHMMDSLVYSLVAISTNSPTNQPSNMPSTGLTNSFKESDIILGMKFQSISTLTEYTVTQIDRFVLLHSRDEATLEYIDNYGNLTEIIITLKQIANNVFFNWWKVSLIPTPPTYSAVPVMPSNHKTYDENDIVLGLQVDCMNGDNWEVDGIRTSYGIREVELKEIFTGRPIKPIDIKDMISLLNNGTWTVIKYKAAIISRNFPNVPPPTSYHPKAGNSVTINGQFIGVDMAYADTPKKKCTCDSKTIFNYGCRCGAFHEGDK
jgi:hypothetical protein